LAATDRVTVFGTQSGDRFWTNVFYVNALTLAEAASWANIGIATAIQSQLNSAFTIVKTVVDHLADDTFVTTPLALVCGSVNAGYLPLFNTVKVDISVAGFGRNDGKFFRGWLVEAIVTDGQIDAGARSSFEDTINGLIADSTAAGVDLVDNQGNLWQVASVRSAIQMRQLHRRRKKVVVP